MYDLSWNITLGNFKLAMIEHVEVNRSVEQLSDTAEITLPATAYNQALDVESKIKRGDKVLVELGYDGDPRTEFMGYIESITSDGGSLVIHCEDDIFKYRVGLKNIEHKNIELNKLLELINKEVSEFYPGEPSLGLSCNYSFTYDKFVVNDATGYDVLKKIQEETKANIYLKEGVLHVHPQYVEIFGETAYDFAVNVESSELKYLKEEDRKFLVEVEATAADGTVTKYTAGVTGGEKVTIEAKTSDAKSLALLAEEELKKRVYTGYEGSFSGWLVPFCDAGYKVNLHDAEYEHKNGSYYVTGVNVKFGKEGGIRTISLGRKLK